MNSKWHAKLLKALALRESEVRLWHSILFAFNVGAPVLVALALGDVASGVAGAVAGLMLSLSDSAGPLGHRLGLLARSTLMLLVFGVLGHALEATRRSSGWPSRP